MRLVLFRHANENFNIFYTQGMVLHDVFDHMLHSSGLALLKDDEKRANFSCYRHSSSSFLIVIFIVSSGETHDETGAILVYD